MRIINPSRIDFVTLKLFCEVARSGSITKGAEICHIALSAASRRLSDFEETAGVRLLERSTQGISLTPTGHIALQHAQRLFNGFERFSSELGDYSQGIRGYVRLWANTSALNEFLPVSLASFLMQHPDIRIDVEEQLSSDTVHALTEGFADLGVFADNTPTAGIDVRHIKTDHLSVVCNAQHPLAEHDEISFKNCLPYDFVCLNRGSALYDLGIRAAQQADTPLRIRVQVRSFDAICKMIAQNLGIGILPIEACRPQIDVLGLKSIRLLDKWATRKLLLGTASGRVSSVACELLLRHLISPIPRA